jgi:hypothetical protein
MELYQDLNQRNKKISSQDLLMKFSKRKFHTQRTYMKEKKTLSEKIILREDPQF